MDLTGCGTTGFQLIRSVKRAFNEVSLNIGQAEEYIEWQYITVCGEPLLLALRSYKVFYLNIRINDRKSENKN